MKTIIARRLFAGHRVERADAAGQSTIGSR